MLNYIKLKEIDEQWKTPYYLMYPDTFKNNVNQLKKSFVRYYNKIIIGYSFKTNFVPALCKIANEQGCFAEVVSYMEYELACKIGFSPSHIIFNGPIKAAKDFYIALQNESIINLDSLYEIEYVINYRKKFPKKNINIGLRVNVELVNNEGISTIQCGLRQGRFGFTVQVLEDIIPLLKANNIIINSIHGHTSSCDRAVGNYLIIINKMLEICKKFDLNDIKYFDIGGGFFGAAAEGIDITNKPTYEDYASSLIPVLLENAWFKEYLPYLVLEPGVSVVANVFSFVSKIYQKKKVGNKFFLVVDGSILNVKPTMHSNNLPYKIYSQEIDNEAKKTEIVDIVGSTCMEKDILLEKVIVKENECKGYLVIDGVGAYTIVLTPTFINYQPPIISMEKNRIWNVRRRETIEDIIKLYYL